MDEFFDTTGKAGCDASLLYRRAAVQDVVELARVQGSAVALPPHFHDEDQVTFVMSGRRRFRIGGDAFEVAAGQSIRIPAGTPHESFDAPDGVVCFNAYLRPGGDIDALVAAITRSWRATGRVWLPEPAMVGAPERGPPTASARLRGSVRAAAEKSGMSREGFSRAFRRTHGLAPSVAGALARLNLARRLLRAGVPLASTAAEAGFADQSHLGRCFRRVFGVTPGVFRAGFAGSHPFQTGPASGV